MENQLIKYFSKFTRLSANESNALMDSMVTKTFKKGDYITKEGQSKIDTFFILSGLIRQYKIVNGEDVSTNFYTEGQWIISLASFNNPTIATDNLICNEDTTVVVGNEKKAQELFKTFPRFETISRAVMETVFAEQQNAMSHYLTDTPEERYLRLLQSKPDLFQRVPQYEIASYIGVKPESLSRIRKRISQKIS